jgi:acid phosphatase
MRWCVVMMALAPALVPGTALAAYPAVGHVVVVIEENHGLSQILGSADCPYINELAAHGALLTRSYAVGHPSEPNYLALFGGSTFGVKDDVCPPAGAPYGAPDLASALAAVGARFVGYSEGLPLTRPAACDDGVVSGYRRKHNGWVDFQGLTPSANLGFEAFPADPSALPQVAFVVPNMAHDMHDGTPAQADAWLKAQLSAYAQWCQAHDDLLIVTFDEDNGAEDNHILTLAYGRRVKAGHDSERVDHYGLLATVCRLFGALPPGQAAHAAPLRHLF